MNMNIFIIITTILALIIAFLTFVYQKKSLKKDTNDPKSTNNSTFNTTVSNKAGRDIHSNVNNN